MADNKTSDPRHAADADTKHDDPLAELARIVGFEDEKDKSTEAHSKPLNVDSDFDLEAELMRELQIEAVDERQPPSAEPVFAVPGSPVQPLPDEVQETASKVVNAQRSPEHSDINQGAEPVGNSGGEAEWPRASTETSEQLNSLEAELQAAFSALEGKRPRTTPVAQAEPNVSAMPETVEETVEAPTPVREPEEAQPAPATSAEPVDGIAESDELRDAYERLQRDIEAAKPAETELEDSEDDLTEMLLAEMAEVEAEAADSVPDSVDIPFDPAHITDSDVSPETIGDLDVPAFEKEQPAAKHQQDTDFGLPLEDELDALAGSGPAPQGYEENLAAEPYQQTEVSNGREEIRPDVIGGGVAAAGFSAAQSARQVYDDDPNMDGYFEDYDEDGLPGEGEFAPEDLDAPDFEDLDLEEEKKPSRKGVVAAVAVVAIAVVGGGGFYIWNSGFGGGSASGGTPVVAALDDPVKVKPEDPGGTTVPNQDLAVYERVAGTETDEGSEQALVTTTEEPIDVVQRTLNPQTLPLEGGTTAVEVAPAATEKSEDRLTANDGLDPDPAAEDGASGVAPRRVRTLVVRPDGTIVTREQPAVVETLAGSSALAPESSVGEGNAPLVTGTTGTVGTDISTNAAAGEAVALATTAGDAVGGEASAAGQSSALPPIDDDLRNTGATPLPQAKPVELASAVITQQAAQAAPAETTSPDPVVVASAPIPTTRPAEQPVNIVEAVTERGNLAGSTQAANPGGYMMQISSQPSEEAARASYETLSQRYAPIIGGRGVEYQRADIENRGVFYRVRIPAGTREAANALCTEYKSAGGSCFVAR
ncbi:MAG: SPOR domain-containing protein [Pseudomonadota bacterium]